jgi:hypothetical protein
MVKHPATARRRVAPKLRADAHRPNGRMLFEESLMETVSFVGLDK